MKLGFIGTGNMAGAIMGGIIRNEIFKPEEIIGADISKESRSKVQSAYGINVTEDNKKDGVRIRSSCTLGEAAVLCGDDQGD